mmetsp:Transcript_15624/g.45090  ORF Transcript_15624/g.45090 Transcript_15624/m.45090 type:complete len:81 (+) Transcript_15624:183-425(+)
MIVLYVHVRELESSFNQVRGLSHWRVTLSEDDILLSQYNYCRKSRLVLQHDLLYLLGMSTSCIFSALSRWAFLFSGKMYF